jgi:hypothetical protein
MQCPVCNTELRVQGSRTLVMPDFTVYRELELVCRNKTCERFGTVVGTVRNDLHAQKAE